MNHVVLLVLLAICLLLTGCPSLGYQNMSAAQIRATEGTLSCTQLNSMYGKGSTIAVNADTVRKGATSSGKIVIECGDSKMTIDSSIGVAFPPQPVPK